jgi:hypothetical protein
MTRHLIILEPDYFPYQTCVSELDESFVDKFDIVYLTVSNVNISTSIYPSLNDTMAILYAPPPRNHFAIEVIIRYVPGDVQFGFVIPLSQFFLFQASHI